MAYCSAACLPGLEGGRLFRPRGDLHKDNVVVAEGIESSRSSTGSSAATAEGRWLVLDARRKSISLRANKLRLVVPVEKREDV